MCISHCLVHINLLKKFSDLLIPTNRTDMVRVAIVWPLTFSFAFNKKFWDILSSEMFYTICSISDQNILSPLSHLCRVFVWRSTWTWIKISFKMSATANCQQNELNIFNTHCKMSLVATVSLTNCCPSCILLIIVIDIKSFIRKGKIRK